VLTLADTDLIKSMFDSAMDDLYAVDKSRANAAKDGREWNTIFKNTYDVLHALAEALIQFDKIKAKTHECLFAYLCEKHPGLDFDWKTLDNMRLARNGSVYYGRPATYGTWKLFELQFKLYIDALKKSVDNKLKNAK